jgi:DNA invertase Pin-like site-specific DNA recombinase
MTVIKPPLKRCAIYTRKSSEEGLEQEFNSLHAQREACESLIKSQKHEGWQLVKTAYDDGGISGGTMERPALQQLLTDIREHKIDVIVVYKVDRLTRSLADFAKMVELFDSHNVSFVSVTQQFNTTSSMGRLTLNVLLSFAQFEREVTGERIRDKIAASKKKGMWMGGFVPLGYDVVEKKLIINQQETETIRHIFTRYLELGSVRLLQAEIAERGIRSKNREKSKKFGKNILSRGTLYNLLSNPVYIGQIRHKNICHPGQHQAIIDQVLWEQVQQQLNNNTVKLNANRQTDVSLLIGKLFDEFGEGLTPSHAMKQGKRYRYYISKHLTTGSANKDRPGWRLPAQEIERIIVQSIRQIFDDHHAITTTLREASIATQYLPAALNAIGQMNKNLEIGKENTDLLPAIIERVNLQQDGLDITLSLTSLMPKEIKILEPITVTKNIPMQIKRRGIEMRMVIGNGTSKIDPTLIKAIVRAHAWYDDLISGRERSIAAIAVRENSNKSYISSVMKLTFLAPDIIEAIISGHQPDDLTADKLIKQNNLPLVWTEQKRVLSFH